MLEHEYAVVLFAELARQRGDLARRRLQFGTRGFEFLLLGGAIIGLRGRAERDQRAHRDGEQGMT
ncbi:MAG TPA: hypothetical protein VIG54_05800 [Lysobacter sp.]